jgi:8-oxo-dGTP pyrophosphatase MutT (NUDIX family)
VDTAVRAVYRGGFPLLQLWWWLTRPTIHGVYVAVWHEGRVLLVRNSYRSFLTFPSGRRGRREAPDAAARRELAEEVGLHTEPGALRPVAEYHVSTRLVEDHVHVFELHLAGAPRLALDHREVVWAAFEDPERALECDLAITVRRYLVERGGSVPGPTPTAH